MWGITEEEVRSTLNFWHWEMCLYSSWVSVGAFHLQPLRAGRMKGMILTVSDQLVSGCVECAQLSDNNGFTCTYHKQPHHLAQQPKAQSYILFGGRCTDATGAFCHVGVLACCILGLVLCHCVVLEAWITPLLAVQHMELILLAWSTDSDTASHKCRHEKSHMEVMTFTV